MVRVLHIEGQQNCQRHFLSHISFHAVEMIKSISHDWESCKDIYSINKYFTSFDYYFQEENELYEFIN